MLSRRGGDLVEWVNAGALLGWLVDLLLPGDALGSSASLRALHELMPEPAWVVLLAALLLPQLAGLVGLWSTGAHPYRWRRRLLIASAVWWSMAAASLFVSNYLSPGVGPYLALGVALAFMAARVGRICR